MPDASGDRTYEDRHRRTDLGELGAQVAKEVVPAVRVSIAKVNVSTPDASQTGLDAPT